MYKSIPIIGLLGGIGSGKSFIARLFGEMGCVIIDSDKLVHEAYDDPEICRRLRQIWGDAVFDSQGRVSRKALAGKVFSDPEQRSKLEAMLHPWVNDRRKQIMEAAAANGETRAFVWDTPLLLETSLDRQCDALVFVDAPMEERLRRVLVNRGWNGEQLLLREKLQEPLDKKRKVAKYMVDNSAEADNSRRQVRSVLSRILSELPHDLPE